MPSLSLSINGRELPSFDLALSALIDEAVSLFPEPQTHEDRFEIFQYLYSAGIMSFRGAAVAMCRLFGVQKPTIYVWMRKADAINATKV